MSAEDLLGLRLWQLLVDLSQALAGITLTVAAVALLFFLDKREGQ